MRTIVFLVALAAPAGMNTSAAPDDDWRGRWSDLLERAEIASSRGEVELAESRFREAVELAARHAPRTLRDVRSRDALAFFLLQSGRYAEAESMYEELLPEWRRLMGPGQPRVATCLNNLGVARFHLGRPEAALDPIREALDIWTRALGPDHPDTIRAERSLTVVAARAGRQGPPAEDVAPSAAY